jgi:O-antigen/teichoic acid export membrane protein
VSRTARFIRALSARAGVSIVSLAVTLGTMPIILAAVGSERLGAYRIGLEYFGYIALLDLGLGGVLTVRFAAATATGDRDRVNRLIRGGLKAYLRVAAVSLFGFLALFGLSGVVIGSADAALEDEFQLGIAICSSGLLLLPAAAFRGLAEARQRGDIVQYSLLAQALAASAVTVAACLAVPSVASLFAGTLAGLIANCAVLVYWGRSDLLTALRGTEVESVALLRGDSPRQALFNFCSQVSVYSDLIVTGSILGPVPAAGYYLTVRLLILVDSQVLGLGASAWAGLVELLHRGERELFHRRMTELTELTSAASCLLLVPVAALTPAFVAAWVGEDQYVGAATVIATLAWTLLHGIIALWAWPVVMAGHVRAILPVMAVGAAVNVGVSAAATVFLGTCGPALGTVANYLGVFVLCFPRVLRRLFDTPIVPLYLAALRPMAIGIPYALGCYAASVWNPSLPSRWGKFAVVAGLCSICAVGYLSCCIFVLLSAEQRRSLRGRAGL